MTANRAELLDSTDRKVRMDLWLWAARFFRSRSLAKQAIEGGKVHVQGQRVKVSTAVHKGMLIEVRQGWDKREVEVLDLSEVRGPAGVAQLLYRETEASIARNLLRTEERRAHPAPDHRPDKKERRQILRFRDIQG